MKALSKSKIISYLQCPKKLWLQVNKPELGILPSGAEARFAQGNQVGLVARSIYDPYDQGELIEPFRDGWTYAFERTSELLAERKPIFEATISAAGGMFLADVMLPSDDGVSWKMIEVKSTTGVKEYHKNDISVQAYVAQAAGVLVEHYSIACIDSSWTYLGGGDYSGLLHETDLTDLATSKYEDVAGWIKKGQETLRDSLEPVLSTGPHCSEPFDCEFFEYCTKDEPVVEYPVQWLPGNKKKILKAMINSGEITDMREAPDDLLNSRQLRVKEQTLAGKIFFDAYGAKAELEGHEGQPAYFLDFETIQFAVPIWEGTRPYQQIPYQFSLHILLDTDDVDHEEFLDLTGDDPSARLARWLVKTCGDTGPIYVYNAGFESGVIKRLAGRFPEHSDALLALNDRLVDLLPIAKTFFYDPKQKGSWSIKSVLPAIVPELNYQELEGVQDGGEAGTAYLEAIGLPEGDRGKEELQDQLLEYCKLDTLAMVKLWEFLTNRIVVTGKSGSTFLAN